jgi:hypothetical protein
MTKQISLTQGQVAIVDDWWFEELNQHKWNAQWRPDIKSFYAVRNSSRLFGKQAKIFMHVAIAGTPNGMCTDHINHNTLDNRSENLRVCTSHQNAYNKRKHIDNTSGYKGVRMKAKKWEAHIGDHGRDYYLGRYSSPEEAARAYDEAAKRLHGEFASLNFP